MIKFSLTDVFNMIAEDLDKNIKDEKLLLYVKTKMIELMAGCVDAMDNVIEVKNKQESMEIMLAKLEHKVERIEEDIYIELDDDEDDCNCDNCDKMHDNDYEFEIVCPYCGDEFVVDKQAQESDEIECPNCENVIELDWDSSSCNGDCSGCHSHHYENEESEDVDSVAEEEESYTLEEDEPDKLQKGTKKSSQDKQKVQKNNTNQRKQTQNKQTQSKTPRRSNQKIQENKPKNQNEDDM